MNSCILLYALCATFGYYNLDGFYLSFLFLFFAALCFQSQKYSSLLLVSLASAFTIAMVDSCAADLNYMFVVWFILFMTSLLFKPIFYLLYTNMTSQILLTNFFYLNYAVFRYPIVLHCPFMCMTLEFGADTPVVMLRTNYQFISGLILLLIMNVVLDLVKHKENFFFLITKCDPNKVYSNQKNYCMQHDEIYEHLD